MAQPSVSYEVGREFRLPNSANPQFGTAGPFRGVPLFPYSIEGGLREMRCIAWCFFGEEGALESRANDGSNISLLRGF